MFAELHAAKNEAEARAVEDKIWKFWRSFADEESQEAAWRCRARRNCASTIGNALLAMEALIKHQPQFAEGWNQLGYMLFLAGSYDASLEAIDKTLTLEPMHYAALAGKGIILIQQGKDDRSAGAAQARAGDQSVAEGAQSHRQGSGANSLSARPRQSV